MTADDPGTSVTDDVYVIVGAGLAGMALAHDLQGQGQGVRVLDKSRGVSGRAATRRTPPPAPQFSEARLDHGARYFTARHPRALALAESGVAAGWNRVWTQGFAAWEDGQITPPAQDGHPRYAPPAGMSTLGRELSTMIGMRATSGSVAIRLRKVVIACSLSSRSASMFTSRMFAPPRTWSTATSIAAP